jgi:hypothetical protein
MRASLHTLIGPAGLALALLSTTPLTAAGMPPVGPPLTVPRAAGDDRLQDRFGDLQRADRLVFVKISYAFQR